MEDDVRFKNGQKLKEVFWNESSVVVRDKALSEDFPYCVDIEVVMESGQMSGVPWAVATFSDGTIRKYNIALAGGVSL